MSQLKVDHYGKLGSTEWAFCLTVEHLSSVHPQFRLARLDNNTVGFWLSDLEVKRSRSIGPGSESREAGSWVRT
ncbi:unnamed protein product, partial [Schistosoma haematobium]